MKTWFSVRLVMIVFLAAGLGGIAAAAVDTAAASVGYEAQLATAKSLAVEKSWAKAQEAYAAALALAPNDESKRWCELGRVDAGWREAGTNAGTEDLLAQIAEFEDLMERYQKPGVEKDEFWFAAMEGWADFRAGRGYWHSLMRNALEDVDYQNEWRRREGKPEKDLRKLARFLDLSSPPDADRLAICDALGEQLPTPEARKRYVEAVRILVIDPERQWDHTVLGRLVEQVRMAARLADSADDRAWFALVAQLLTAPQADTNAAKATQWRAVLVTAKGTRWEALAAGAEFCWRAASGWEPERAAGTPVDLVARVRECDALLGRLWPELKLDLSADAFDWAHTDMVENLVGVAKHGWVTPVVLALGNWRYQWQEPRLELSLPSQVKPGESVGGYYGATAVDAVEFTLARLTPEEWLQYECFRQTSGKLGKEPTGEVLRRWSVATDLTAQLGFRSGAVELGAALPAGFYLVTAEGRAKERVTRNSRHFMVTGVEVALLTRYYRPAELYCIDAVTRWPVQGAAVTGIVGDWMDEGSDAVSGQTGADGRTLLVTKSAGGNSRSWLTGMVGNQPFAIEWRGLPNLLGDRPLDGDVIFDREVYRPGETVRWKLVLREQQDGHFANPPAGTRLKVTAEVGGTVLFEEREFELNAFGTIAGEIELSRSSGLGYGRLSFTLVGDSKRRISTMHSSPSFRVEHYRPPATTVTVELASGAEMLRPGQDAAFRVNAKYFSGGPMSGALVRCRVSFRAADFDDGSELGGARPLARRAALPKPMDYTVTTDDAGAAVVRCSLPEDLPEGTMAELQGSVLPVGTEEVRFQQTFLVTQTGYHFTPLSETRDLAYWLGTEVKFQAQVFGSCRQPAAKFEGTAQIIECRWNEVWRLPGGRIVMGAEAQRLRARSTGHDEIPTAAGSECLHAGYEETVVAEMKAVADAKGLVEVLHRPERTGLYRLRLLQNGTSLFVPKAAHGITVVSEEKTAELALSWHEMTVAVLGPVVNGAPLSVLVASPSRKLSGWMVVSGSDRVVVQPFELAGPLSVLTVPNPPRFTGSGRIEVQIPGDQYRGGVVTFATERADSSFAIGIVPSAVESRPGSDAQVRLEVTSGASIAIPAELCVNVIDEAVATLGRDADWLRSSAFGNRSLLEAELNFSKGGGSQLQETKDARAGIVSADLWEGRRHWMYARMSSLSSFTGLDSNCWAEPSKQTRSLGLWGMPFSQTRSLPSIRLRTRFDSTAFWAPQVVTDAKGEATVSFKYPDNLTQWRIEAYAVGADGNSFGTATAFTRTSLPFQARLNLPRFLVAGDRADPSATLVNRTDAALAASAELKIGGAVSGGSSTGRASLVTPLPVEGVSVPAQGETQTSWAVRAEKPGTAEFTLKAWAGAEGDGMVLKLPVLEDGILQKTAASGRLGRGEAKRELSLVLPEPLDPARTAVRVLVSGSHAAAMLDALPYLVDYPYGCVEQTMSRFLPAVIAKRTLGELGFDAASVETRILGEETAADVARRAKTAGLGRLEEVIEKSLARLIEAQRHDGGFGWWPQATQMDFWMTAYTAWGLELARSAGVEVPVRLAERTSSALVAALAEKDRDWDQPGRADGRAWALAALAGTTLGEREGKQRAEAWAQCYAARGNLTPSGRACLALAAAKLGTAEERAVLLRNLENGVARVKSEDSGDTAHWGAMTNYWRASDGAVEATALALLALLELEPRHALVEPAMNWLVLNRRSGHWESTRATAFAVLALSRFVQARGEALGETEVELVANDAVIGRVKLNRETLLSGPTSVALPVAKLRGGENRISLRRVSGDGPAYAVVLAESWATGDGVKPAGHQAEVARGFVRQKATPTLIGTLRIVPEALPSGGAATAGEEVQAVVSVTVPNELEYVMIEVPKPAGCEPLNSLSGWDARIRRAASGAGAAEDRRQTTAGGTGRAIYREERDEKSVFFLDRLEAGTWEIRFGMRAVTPGDFRALPVQVEAMYVPEIRANSDAQRVQIEPRPAAR